MAVDGSPRTEGYFCVLCAVGSHGPRGFGLLCLSVQLVPSEKSKGVALFFLLKFTISLLLI